MKIHPCLSLFLFAAFYIGAPSAQADGTSSPAAIAPLPLVDLSSPLVENRFEPSCNQVTVAPIASPQGVVVTIQPGDAVFPGVTLKPTDATAWNLMPFSRIEARITNTCAKPLYISLRIDGNSWDENNADGAPIDPGKTVTVIVRFGYSYGKPAQKLPTSSLSELLIFNTKVQDGPDSFRIESITGAGIAGEKPPVDTNAIRVTPDNGLLLGPGAAPLHADTDLVHHGDSSVTLADSPHGQVLKVTLNSDGEWQEAGIQPTQGRWRLVNSVEVHARVRNSGSTPVTPVMKVDSNGGSVKGAAAGPLAPGAETEIVASYINPHPWKNTPPALTPDSGTGNHFVSDMVSAVLFALSPGDGHGTLTVESIQAISAPTTLPDWLGQRPPVDGDWTKTFDEEFDGSTIDESKWNIYAENYWDPRCHFSRDNVILGDGVARLRFEKKTGFQADDPTKKQTDYATGYLGTFGKFTQRYGYWEARVKVPSAPGLWPAFWLMPDRGEDTPDRETTEKGGMEFDIMEFLTEWGPCRYNIAMHWDGYGTKHKSVGYAMTYAQPDKDGFVTAGLLWTPGSAIYYANGREVFDFESPRVSSVPSYLLFDFVSGGWDNQPLDDARLPDDFVIDYVRVWQRPDLAAANPPTAPDK